MGKGDMYRPTDLNKYRKNWDKVFKKKPTRTLRSGESPYKQASDPPLQSHRNR